MRSPLRLLKINETAVPRTKIRWSNKVIIHTQIALTTTIGIRPVVTYPAKMALTKHMTSKLLPDTCARWRLPPLLKKQAAQECLATRH